MASDGLIRFACPDCGRPVKTAAHYAGRKAKCPGCGHPLDVPATTTAEWQDAWIVEDVPTPSAPVPEPPIVRQAKPRKKKLGFWSLRLVTIFSSPEEIRERKALSRRWNRAIWRPLASVLRLLTWWIAAVYALVAFGRYHDGLRRCETVFQETSLSGMIVVELLVVLIMALAGEHLFRWRR